MPAISRRSFLAHLIAAPAIVRCSSLMSVHSLFDGGESLIEPVMGLIAGGELWRELSAITRKAFVPVLYTQIYESAPIHQILIS